MLWDSRKSFVFQKSPILLSQLWGHVSSSLPSCVTPYHGLHGGTASDALSARGGRPSPYSPLSTCQTHPIRKVDQVFKSGSWKSGTTLGPTSDVDLILVLSNPPDAPPHKWMPPFLVLLELLLCCNAECVGVHRTRYSVQVVYWGVEVDCCPWPRARLTWTPSGLPSLPAKWTARRCLSYLRLVRSARCVRLAAHAWLQCSKACCSLVGMLGR